MKTTKSTETTFNELEQTAKNSLNDFSTFVTDYQKIPLKEKAPFWHKIYGTKVTWTGKAIDEGTKRVYLIAEDRYEPGMTFTSVQGTENQYYTFVVLLDHKVIDGTYTNGDSYTFTGSLESRGTDEELDGFFHWKLYDAVQN